MAFGLESAIDPELLRQLQVGMSGFILIMVMIMFHNVTSKLGKKPMTDKEIEIEKEKIRQQFNKKLLGGRKF